MRKRLLSALLALCMVLVLLPGTAWAADIINQTVSVDEYFCLYIKQDNSLWACGGNLPSPMHHYRYEDFEWRKKGVSGSFKVMDDVRSAYTCQYSCFAIKTDNSLWAWGGNEGALGCGNTDRQLTPVKIMDNVASFSTISYNWHGEATAEGLSPTLYGYFSLALKTDGSLWGWGTNHYGEVGDGSNETRLSPVKIMDDVSYVISDEGFAYESPGPYVYAVKNDGSLWSWGANRLGQLGNGTMVNQNKPSKVLDNVASVTISGGGTAAIQTDGSLWTWGGANVSRDGYQYISSQGGQFIYDWFPYVATRPVKIADRVQCTVINGHSNYFVQDSNLWAWGDEPKVEFGGDGQPLKTSTPICVLKDVSKLYRFRLTDFAIKTDGSLWGWGNNSNGQMGVGSIYEYQKAPVKIADNVDSVVADSSTTCILKKDGTLWGCGSNQNCKLGQSDTVYTQPTLVKIADNVKLPTSMKASPAIDEPSNWCVETVSAAIRSGLVPESLQKGYQKPLPRAGAAQLFVNLIGQCSGQSAEQFLMDRGLQIGNMAFSDTNDPAVAAAAALGIVNGTGGGQFDPNGTLTRAQAAVMICRIAEVMGIDTSGHSHNFVDMSGHWADDALSWPVYVGIINGTGQNQFSPDTELTCEQAIVIAHRAFEVLHN